MKRWLSRFGWWLVDCFPHHVEDRANALRLRRERKPSEDEIDAALREAFAMAGVNVDLYALDYEPGSKRYEILHHASCVLGNELKTVGDLKAMLR